ncbi:Nucleoside triphosphate pyrophosphohydrolase [Neochlamydia sp. AcF65]|nr:Nucleoside triphosphate pyrophosphohydrolase [Neochlamydia sp. AcF65]
MAMQEFNQLIEIIERLLAPGGCPWDQAQTLHSLRSSLLEESCEVIEAIDLGNNSHIQEELGDLFFNAVFLCKIAEKEKRFTFGAVLNELNEKLVRRHPHVFGEGKKINTSQELSQQWEEIKKREKGKDTRKSALDGISKGLPALSRAQKVLKKIKNSGYLRDLPTGDLAGIHNENELGKHLLFLVEVAQKQGLDAEHALRKTLTHLEKDFQLFEKKAFINNEE